MTTTMTKLLQQKLIDPLLNICQYRLLAVFLLGFSCGIPLALIGATLTMWVSRIGIDVKTVGLLAMVSIPFSFKFLWASIFDYIPLPYFSKRFGFRKAWLISIQVCLIIAIIFLGETSPLENISITAIAAIIVAFVSASQDIIVDALRIEVLHKEEQALGASLYVYGYRIAMLVSGGGALLLADHTSWDNVYFIMALTIIAGIIAVIFLKEPSYSQERLNNLKNFSLRESINILLVNPLSDFCKRPNWLHILFFIVLYKFADVLLESLQSNFYVSRGFSNSEVAYIVKGFGFIMTMLGMFLGGIIYYRFRTFKSLFIVGILQILSNLLFIWLAETEHNLLALSIVISIEKCTSAMSMVVMVAYLSSLCNIAYTAAQYALLSSVVNVGRTILVAPAGYIVEYLGWTNFIFITALVGIPGMILLYYLKSSITASEQVNANQ